MPLIGELELSDFRNYAHRKFQFGNRNILLLGPNGSGKTNLLEAIGFLSLLRSFRGAAPREMVRIGTREFRVRARLCKGRFPEELCVTERLSGKRELLIGSSACRRGSEFIREFHTVPFIPEDREIAAGSSGFRRRYFDILISALEPEYLLRLSRYMRALTQRNRAFRTAPAAVTAFEMELAEAAPFIALCRSRYARMIEAEVAKLLPGESGELKIVYRCDYPDSPEEYLHQFALRREREKVRGCTLIGPQLDEFDLLLNGKSLRAFGSTGQIRIVTLLLKLAQFHLLRNNSNIPVAVLADDVTGELDERNRALFLSTVSEADQCFFTFAADPGFVLEDCAVLNMKQE